MTALLIRDLLLYKEHAREFFSLDNNRLLEKNRKFVQVLCKT